MLLTQQQLPVKAVMCEICWVLYLPARQCSAQQAHTASVLLWLPFQPSEMGVIQVHFIRSLVATPKFETTKKYKIFAEMHQRVHLRKVHNVHRPILWHGWHAWLLTSSITRQISGANISSVHSYEGQLSDYLNWLKIIHNVHFNVLVWWKLQESWCYCVKCIRVLLFFDFIYFTT